MDREFGGAREFSAPGREFDLPGREWAAVPPEAVRFQPPQEPGQSDAMPAKAERRRRPTPLMLVASAVAVVLIAVPGVQVAVKRDLPQPQGLTQEYRDYLNSLMAACREGDPLALYDLAYSPTMDDLWCDCLGPYQEELLAQGFRKPVYFNGVEMTQDIDAGPLLQVEVGTTNDLYSGQLLWHEALRYYADGLRKGENAKSLWYTCVEARSPGDSELFCPWWRVFSGELSVSPDNPYKQVPAKGVYEEYATYRYTDTGDSSRLDKRMVGTFTERSFSDGGYGAFLEDGELRYIFSADGAYEDFQVRGGALPGDDPRVSLSWEEPGEMGDVSIGIGTPDGIHSFTILFDKTSDRLEDHLRYSPWTQVRL